ncbi:unnamed protein product [Caenorhabditis brenneri]
MNFRLTCTFPELNQLVVRWTEDVLTPSLVREDKTHVETPHTLEGTMGMSVNGLRRLNEAATYSQHSQQANSQSTNDETVF